MLINSERSKYFKIILLLLLSIGLTCYVLIKPSLNKYNQLLLDEVILKKIFKQKQTESANYASYQKQLNEIKQEWLKWIKPKSTNDEIPFLLKTVSTLATQTALTMEHFTPMPKQDYNFYTVIPIKITVTGKYQQLTIFLNKIAHLKQIINLTDFELLRTTESTDQKRNKNTLMMSALIKIYPNFISVH